MEKPILVSAKGFNPRTRTGCDSAVTKVESAVAVSIHAPARGATSISPGDSTHVTCFNPRTRTGCDLPDKDPSWPCGGFNPRTRTGCDVPCSSRSFYEDVSIHAPARGATLAGDGVVYLGVFQSTHPHGVRPKFNKPIRPVKCFNPRTRTGCDK